MSFDNNINEVIDNVTFYGDAVDTDALYAEYCTHQGKIRRLTSIKSKIFTSYIRRRIQKLGIKKLTASTVIEDIEDRYLIDEHPTRITVHKRTAGSIRANNDKQPVIEYNLSDTQQRSVVITSNGWSITTKPTYKFLSLTQILPQVEPQRSSTDIFELIGRYVNLQGDTLTLFVIWLIQSFSLSSHYALVISAERGSGKSSLGRVIRKVVDPSSIDITTFPDKFDGLQSALANSYLSIFDNMSGINKAGSDLLCSAITGATISKRALYSNNDLFVQRVHNIVVMNGISIFPNESDLSERCLLVKMKKLKSDNIKTEGDIWTAFERDRPYILGKIFDTLSAAMNIVDTLKNEKLPRMADAYIEMLAIAVALGISKDEFSRIFEDNKNALEKERANTPLVEAVREFMDGRMVAGRKASGTVSSLYSQIKENYSGERKDLPKSPAKFSSALKAERATLEVLGYEINFDDTHSEGTHLDIIKKKIKN